MSQPTTAAHSGWTVTGQREDQQLPPGAAAFVKGVAVSFATNAGNAGSVFVPYTTYSPTTVAAAVSERAAQLDAITALSAPATR